MRHLRRIGYTPGMSKDEALAKLQGLVREDVTLDDSVTDPVCGVCEDRGWVTTVEGRPMYCPAKCTAADDVHQWRVQGKQARILSKVERKAAPMAGSLADFHPRTEDQAVAYRAALRWMDCDMRIRAREGGMEKRSLVLVGEVGSGKTFLSSCIANDLADACVDVLYIKFGELVRRVNHPYQTKDAEVSSLEVLEVLSSVAVLVIDDLGLHHVTDSTKDILFYVIDSRYDVDLPTVVTTNLDPVQMGVMFGKRIGGDGGRLTHMAHWIRLDGNQRDVTGVL